MTTENTDHRVAVAIDLGTHGTGFAWCEISALNRSASDREIYYYNRWPGRQAAYPKNLSAICLDPAGEVAAWGFEARQMWIERLQNGDADGWGYSYAFKMALKRDGGPLVSTQGGTVDLSQPETVINLVAKYLRCVKDTVLDEVGASGWAMHHIRWCVTVPAIWGDIEKERVRTAAAAAGLPADDLLIGIEPEVAALYCSIRMSDVLDVEGTTERLALDAVDTRFLVIDGGGGTVDLSAHRTTTSASGETRLDDIGAPVGEKLGSEYLNYAFRKEVLADRFGSEALDRLERECPAGLAELEDAWEENKVTLRATLDASGARVTGRMRIMVPGEVWDLLEPSVRDHLVARAGNYKYRIVMEPDEVQALFDRVVDEVLERVELQLAEMRQVTERSGGEYLLLIGGFCYSDYLRHRIRHRFADRGVAVLSPTDPATAVLLGAVHFCVNPELIRSRRSRLTYGFGMALPFDSALDPVEKQKTDSNGQVLCDDRFRIAVHKGEPVEVNQRFDFPVIPIDKDGKTLAVHFYATRDLDPRYVDGCEELVVLNVDLSDSVGQPIAERGVDISVFFGRTTIEVEATSRRTGERVDADFEFRSMY